MRASLRECRWQHGALACGVAGACAARLPAPRRINAVVNGGMHFVVTQQVPAAGLGSAGEGQQQW